MFQSIKVLDPSKVPPIDNNRFSFELIDTDFTTIVYADTYWEAVIKEYEKRKLNVAKNLVMVYKYVNTHNPMPKLLDYMMEVSNSRYDEDIQKYMMLV